MLITKAKCKRANCAVLKFGNFVYICTLLKADCSEMPTCT